MSKRTPVDDQFRHTRGTLADLLNQAKGLARWLDQREAEVRQNLEALGADTQNSRNDPKDPTLARLACDLRAVLFRVSQVRLFGITEAGMLEMERLGYACAVAKMRLSEPVIDLGAKAESNLRSAWASRSQNSGKSAARAATIALARLMTSERKLPWGSLNELVEALHRRQTKEARGKRSIRADLESVTEFAALTKRRK